MTACKNTSPRNIADRTTEKNGSMALIVWVNDTATFPRLIFVKRFPNVWTNASGRIAASCSSLKKSKPHNKNIYIYIYSIVNSYLNENSLLKTSFTSTRFLKPERRRSTDYLSTTNLRSFVEIKSPHEKNKYSAYGKLNCSDSHRKRIHLENLWASSVRLLSAVSSPKEASISIHLDRYKASWKLKWMRM